MGLRADRRRAPQARDPSRSDDDPEPAPDGATRSGPEAHRTELDRVVSTLSLHHWADPPAILRELHRVLRPSGSVILYDVRFSYSPRQFAAFVADGPFVPDSFSHRLGPFGTGADRPLHAP